MSIWTQYSYANVSGLYGLVDYGNTVMGGMFGVAILGMVFVIMYMIFRKSGDLEGYTAASTITLLLAVLMRVMGAINDSFLMLFGLMTAVGIFMLWYTRR